MESDQLVIYTTRSRSWTRDNREQIQIAAGWKTWTRDLQISNPVHSDMLPSRGNQSNWYSCLKRNVRQMYVDRKRIDVRQLFSLETALNIYGIRIYYSKNHIRLRKVKKNWNLMAFNVLFVKGGRGTVRKDNVADRERKQGRSESGVWRRTTWWQGLLHPAYCVLWCSGWHEDCQRRGIFRASKFKNMFRTSERHWYR